MVFSLVCLCFCCGFPLFWIFYFNVCETGITSEIAIVTVKDNSKLPPTVTSDDQHVIFPAHFQVYEALKNGLTFGSFDPSFGPGMMYNNGTNSETNSACAVESSQGSDETVEEPSPRLVDIMVSTLVQVDLFFTHF